MAADKGTAVDLALVVMVNMTRIHIMIIPIYTLNTLNRPSYPIITKTTAITATFSVIDIKPMHHLPLPTRPHQPRILPHHIMLPPTLPVLRHIQPQVQVLVITLPHLKLKPLPQFNLDHHSPLRTTLTKITMIRNHILRPLISIKNGE